MTVADRIRARREELNMSQEELAKRIGCKDKSTISKIEKSGDDISMKNIERIAAALHVSSNYLMGWDTFKEQVNTLRKEIMDKNFQLLTADDNSEQEIMKIQKELAELTSEHGKMQQMISNMVPERLRKYEKLFSDDSSTEATKALEMYRLYEQAPPHIQAAVESLLKGAPPHA